MRVSLMTLLMNKSNSGYAFIQNPRACIPASALDAPSMNEFPPLPLFKGIGTFRVSHKRPSFR